jgi:hypothetical protein
MLAILKKSSFRKEGWKNADKYGDMYHFWVKQALF